MATDFMIILPTLNEREGLAKTLDELFSIGVSPDRIIVVDGGSTDGTCEEAVKRGVRCVLQEGRGKADAIRTALKIVNAQAVVIMDADFTYPASRVFELLSLLGQCDEVIGARLRPEPGAQGLVFKFGNWVLTKFFNLIFGTKISDVLSGMYAVRTEALEGLEKSSQGFGIESEIAAHIVSTGGSICEVPIEYRRRVGRKKLGVRHGLHIAFDMMRLAFRYNPTFFTFLIASLMAIPGLLIAGWVAYRWIFLGVKHYVWGIIGVTLASVGMLSGIMAILSLYLKRMEIRLLRQIKQIAKRRH